MADTANKPVIFLAFANDRDDCTARLWDVKSGKIIHSFKHNETVLGSSFSNDESQVLTWSDDHTA